jgi:ribokinase
VVGLGRVGVALTGITPHLPEIGAGDAAVDLAAVTLSLAPGIAVAVRAATAFGCAGRVAGTVATDSMGRFARAELEEAGIDEATLIDWGDLAPCRVTAVERAGRRLTMTHEGLDPEGHPPSVDLDAVLHGASALLVDTTWLDAQIVAARAAHARGLPVIADVSDVVGGVGELIGLADVLITSERVAAELAPRAELPEALTQLRALGPRAVIVTMGEAGAIGLHGRTLVECPAFPVDVLDASGAGAVFHGAFAAALLSDLPLARCIEVGAASAALSCKGLGPWDAIPGRDEILALVRGRG